MNRSMFAAAVSVLLLGGAAVTAQDKPMEKAAEKTVTTTTGTTTSKAHTVVGTVKEYEAGKSIKVLVGKKTRSTTVDPAVAVGSKVKIVESKNADGVKTLRVNPAS